MPADYISGWIMAVLKQEGGYTNDPADRGGETNYGITAATARAYGYTGRMIDLTLQQAIDIYRAQYVVKPGFDQVALVDDALGERLFQLGVNMGPSVGGKYLQRALNVLNNGSNDFPELVVDGGCGAKTIAALRTFAAKRGTLGRKTLLFMVAAFQSVHYVEIAEANPSQERFEYGWQSQRAIALGL